MNYYLLNRAVKRLQETGFKPYTQQRVPAGDGGISLGQIKYASYLKFLNTKNMCLAVPGKILSIQDSDNELMRFGKVSFGGIVKDVNLAYTPEAKVGDYVIVHVGFALNTVDESEAMKVFEYLKEIDGLDELTGEEKEQ